MGNRIKGQYGGFKTDVLLIPPIFNLMNPHYLENSLFQGLAALDAGLRLNGFRSGIYVPGLTLFEKEDFLHVAKDILTFKPAIVGFSTWCISYPASLLISEKIKEIKPETYIVFGGPQASSLGKETIERFPFVDYVLCGECDYTFPELVRYILECQGENELSKISGLTFRFSDGTIYQNKTEGFIQNLDNLPLISFSRYNKRQKTLMLDVGRGCPFHCTYCSTNDFFSKTYRTKSAERILVEMDMAFDHLGIRNFEFLHDMLTLDKSYMVDLCTRLINHGKKNNRKYFWNCSARIDCITEDLLMLMKEAGCRSIFFGIESGSEKIQRSIKKNLKVDKVYEISEICRDLEIDVHASFMIGFPDETEEDLEKTLRCIVRLSTRGVLTQVSELSVLPGTPLYNANKDQLKFDGLLSNFSKSFYSAEEIRQVIKYPEIFSSFYYLPVHTMDRLSSFLLESLINLLPQFRNTLFVLRETIINDLENVHLFSLFMKFLPDLKEHLDKRIPLISDLVSLLKDYLLLKIASPINPHVFEVFTYESIKALMLARYARWKIIDPYFGIGKLIGISQENKGSFHLMPFWQTFTSPYRLKSILPAENGWQTGKLNVRKGNFHYLIIAVSDRKCKVSRISPSEFVFLENLSLKTGKSSDSLSRDIMAGYEADPLWRKMSKLGVIKMTG